MGKITPLVKAAVISLILVVFISFVLPASNSALREISYKNLAGVEHVMPVLEHKFEKPSTEYHNKSAAVAAPVVNINSKTNASCSDNADGSIRINVTGGTEPYSFSWTGPGSFSSSNEDISNLSEGPYSVTVTDADGNSSTPKSTTIAVEDNEDPTVRTQNITVQLDTNGNATIS
ncbi:SprB repeat-containing protein, partial [Zunongwangia sp. F297]